ncbi:uncharacterized protein LOC115786615 isoform X2 [Archocentrus centrarchus]|uniref:uncharacterized protein LOC115777603 isoform X2 n=1 Tax=Archocentrus centrarchus TaxID=63155 RepID=UPI0011EA402B|nr:uncharacterized protein LOC115777603 isoform X2 [Archocentrus centrarchus]XP_030594729.1 uncharacterized protein LOC115786615 isoform X2 [Archocentrus centrarchus]
MAGIPASSFYGRNKVASSLTEAERILNRIIEGDSDIDLSEDESQVSQTGEVENSDEEPDEDDLQDAGPDVVDKDTGLSEVYRRPIWSKTNMFMPVLEEHRFADDGTLMTRSDWSPQQYFQQYIDQKSATSLLTTS